MPESTKPLMTRRQIGVYLRANGFPIGDGTLMKLCAPACGEGPPVAAWLGNRALHDPDASGRSAATAVVGAVSQTVVIAVLSATGSGAITGAAASTETAERRFHVAYSMSARNLQAAMICSSGMTSTRNSGTGPHSMGSWWVPYFLLSSDNNPTAKPRSRIAVCCSLLLAVFACLGFRFWLIFATAAFLSPPIAVLATSSWPPPAEAVVIEIATHADAKSKDYRPPASPNDFYSDPIGI
jgi:hypothetical protein